MNNWQEYTVYLLLFLCIVRISMSIYHFLQRQKEDNPCTNCQTGCDLKHLYDKKRSNCHKNEKKTKKSCCE